MIDSDLITGWQMHQEGRSADAARRYHAVLARQPDNADALHLFGILHHQNGYFARAIELIGQAIAVNPKVPAYHANLAEAYRALGQHQQAIDCCLAALQLTPNYPEAANNFGLALHALGRFADAVVQFRAALRMRPEFPLAQNNLGTSLRELGRLSETLQAYRDAIVLDPNLALPHSNLGQMLVDEGQAEEGLTYCLEAVRLQPNLSAAHNNLGNAYRALERWSEAQTAYDEALRLVNLVPGELAQVHANRGLALFLEHKRGAAFASFRKAVELAPDDVAMRQYLANAHDADEDYAAALSCWQQIVELNPKLALGHNKLGSALQQEGRFAEAGACYRRALELSPDYVDALLSHGSLHEELGDLTEAEACYRRAQDLYPQAPGPLGRLAMLLRGKLPDSDRDAILVQLGRAESSGTFLPSPGTPGEGSGVRAETPAPDRSVENIRDCCSGCTLQPSPPTPLPEYRARGEMPPSPPTPLPEYHRARGEMLFAQSLPPRSPARGPLLFGLAHVLDAQGKYAEAADCLEQANSLALQQRRREGKNYDPAVHSALVDRIITGFTPKLFDRLAGAGDDTRQPVFVFGMPRSGTTLVEQVLASHSCVHGAGELRLARDVFVSIPDLLGRSDEMLPCLEALDAAAVQQMSRQYLDNLQVILDNPLTTDTEPRPSGSESPRAKAPPLPDGRVSETRPSGSGGASSSPKDRVVDKMPDNYLYLGLLALLFPRATFIHVRRDLRDVAVSCWMTNFRSIRWANDPDHLANRCRDYVRLMQHWQTVLPVPVHEVVYERLVDDFETEAPRLVAACGLQWELACERFHETTRPVKTASVTQVRQPLYRRSLARWKHYEKLLADLFARLPSA